MVSEPDITISGGEPTLVPFLSDLASFLHGSGAKLTLYTNVPMIWFYAPLLAGSPRFLWRVSLPARTIMYAETVFFKSGRLHSMFSEQG